MTKIQKRLSMIALLLANFIGGLDTTMLNTALPQIIKDLNGINQLGLLTSMLLFFIAMTTVLWGKLGEVIGNKKAFQLSILIFAIASILGGFSVNIWMMVFARGLMGIGIGGMISIPFVIYAKLFPDAKERAVALGWVTAFYGVASILGPIVGGFVVDVLGWSWIFFSLVPFPVVSLVLIQIFYKETVISQKPRVDYIGSGLLVIISGVILYWISNLPKLNIFMNSLLAMFVIVSGYMLWKLEKKETEPILPISLLVYAFAIGYSIYAPMWAQVVLGTSATMAGGTQIFSSIAVMLATRFSAKFISKWSFEKLINIGFIAMSVSVFMMAFAPIGVSYYYISISGAFLGLGHGLIFPSAQVAFQEVVPKEQLNIATTFSLLLRTLGQTLMASIYGLVYASQVNGINSIEHSYQGLHIIFIIAAVAVIFGWIMNKITWKL